MAPSVVHCQFCLSSRLRQHRDSPVQRRFRCSIPSSAFASPWLSCLTLLCTTINVPPEWRHHGRPRVNKLLFCQCPALHLLGHRRRRQLVTCRAGGAVCRGVIKFLVAPPTTPIWFVSAVVRACVPWTIAARSVSVGHRLPLQRPPTVRSVFNADVSTVLAVK